MTPCSPSKSHNHPSLSYLKFHEDVLRDTVTVKRCLCWGVAVSFYFIEFYAHARCWQESFLYPHTVRCTQLMLGHRYAVLLVITEAICCGGLSVALMSMLWDMPSSIQEHGLRGYFNILSTGWAELIGASFVVFTMSMGIWLLVAGPPHLVAYYFHLFEIACAVLVVNALACIMCDLAVSAYHSKTMKFLIQLATCDDNQFESDADWDNNLRKVNVNTESSGMLIGRAIFLWIVFGVAFSTVIRRSSGRRVHSAVDAYFGSLAIVCSGHISAMIARNCGFLLRSLSAEHALESDERADERAPLRAV